MQDSADHSAVRVCPQHLFHWVIARYSGVRLFISAYAHAHTYYHIYIRIRHSQGEPLGKNRGGGHNSSLTAGDKGPSRPSLLLFLLLPPLFLFSPPYSPPPPFFLFSWPLPSQPPSLPSLSLLSSAVFCGADCSPLCPAPSPWLSKFCGFRPYATWLLCIRAVRNTRK